ncbi:MAG TPA: HIT domain-containing protein [Pyrinomonadaceae bacterium]|nr:HIT domain-containing protein [Pyrinomonadaceae bacterium]
MDHLWSPWRYKYINSGDKETEPACVFCALLSEATEADEGNYILHRARHNFVVLNLYPYISGHLLVIPYEHLSELDAASKETTDEMMDLAKRCQTALREAYSPQGFNLGMNLGRSAGAGVAEHFHLHIMPRWTGDTNFMTTIAETRVHPEDLAVTYSKLKGQI